MSTRPARLYGVSEEEFDIDGVADTVENVDIDTSGEWITWSVEFEDDDDLHISIPRVEGIF